jgi:hypothetical protein
LADAAVAGRATYRRLVLVVASPGADVSPHLALLADSGARIVPGPTELFTAGVPELFGNYVLGRAGAAGAFADRDVTVGNGLFSLADERTFLDRTRALTDELLLAAAGAVAGEVVVEHSPWHRSWIEIATALYPDAVVVEIEGGDGAATALAARFERDRARLAHYVPDRVVVRPGDPPDWVDDVLAAANVTSARSPRTADQLPALAATIDESGLHDRLVVIVGAHRSGTTWLEHLLLAHPLTGGVDERETWLFASVAPLASSPALARLVERDRLLAALRRWCDSLLEAAIAREHPGAAWFVEKTPNHGDLLPLVGEIYPDAWVVHAIRDGRDVARSLTTVKFGTDDIRLAAAGWRRAVTAARAGRSAVARYREVRYESLVADPVGVVADVFAWVGLPVDDSVRDAVGRRVGARVSRYGTTGPVGPGKWRSLDAAALTAVDDAAGDLLVELGYLDQRVVRRGMRVRPLRAMVRAVRRARRGVVGRWSAPAGSQATIETTEGVPREPPDSLRPDPPIVQLNGFGITD